MSMWFVCLRGWNPRGAGAAPSRRMEAAGSRFDGRRDDRGHTRHPPTRPLLVCGNFRTHMTSNRRLSNQPQVNSCNRTNKI